MEFSVYPIYQPLRSGRIWHKVNFLSRVQQVWIQSCPSPRLVASPRLKNLVAGGRIIEFIPFPRVLVLCERQSVLSGIWTRIAVSISCDDNHYTTGTSKNSVFMHERLLSKNLQDIGLFSLAKSISNFYYRHFCIFELSYLQWWFKRCVFEWI